VSLLGDTLPAALEIEIASVFAVVFLGSAIAAFGRPE
jgi:hypothetical protein